MNREEQIEFIREKVILANNPECKTYEEALEKERVFGAYVKLDKDHVGYKSWKEAFDRKNELPIIKGICESAVAVGYMDNYDCEFISRVKQELFKCLGLPLTLERVLVALDKVNFVLYKKEAIYIYHPSLNNYRLIIEYLCLWQANKTLDQQSNETISKIAELLK